MPGTTAQSIPAASSAAVSSSSRAKDRRIARLQPHHLRARAGMGDHRALISACGVEGPKPSLPAATNMASRRARSRIGCGHQPVMDHHIGLVQQPPRPKGQKVGVARSGADQIDPPGPRCLRQMPGQQRVQRRSSSRLAALPQAPAGRWRSSSPPRSRAGAAPAAAPRPDMAKALAGAGQHAQPLRQAGSRSALMARASTGGGPRWLWPPSPGRGRRWRG
jgi:hypothetical protein